MSNIENGVFQAMRMAARREAERERRRPTCAWCDEPITDDVAYRIDGYLVCPYCIEQVKEYVHDDEGY